MFASLYNGRAIAYRKHQGIEEIKIGLSAGIQIMVRSDKGVSGVAFTLDTESGFDEAVLITAAYGLGETIVQGKVSPDEFYVHKPMLSVGKQAILRRHLGKKALKMIYAGTVGAKKSTKIVAVPLQQQQRFCLSDEDIYTLARQALIIEKHYGRPMDIEWGKDGMNGEIYILQARPETIQSQKDRNREIWIATWEKWFKSLYDV